MRSNWNGVACSSDGSTLLAASLNGPISVSTNQGVTWQESNLVDSFQGVACSADGKRLVVVAAHQPSPPLTTSGIYLSSDGGNTWTQANLPSLMWFSAASSADGTTIAAGGPYVYVSTNSGTNWNPTGLPIANYFGLACSADGTKMIAGSASYSTGAVFTSSDSGVTWTPAPLTNLNYFSVFSSADGTKLAAAAFRGPIYLSSDSGGSWAVMDAPLTNWYALAGSADGNALIAASMDISGAGQGLVYTWQSTPAPRLNLLASAGNLVLSWTLPSRKFVVQQNSDVGTTNWTDVPTMPVLNSRTLRNEVTLPGTTGSVFYRLISR